MKYSLLVKIDDEYFIITKNGKHDNGNIKKETSALNWFVKNLNTRQQKNSYQLKKEKFRDGF